MNYSLHRRLIAGALCAVLGAGFWSAAKAQATGPATCVPGSGADWMVSSDPLAARIRPAECVSVEQTPPDFGWPELSADSQYFVTLTYPDGSQRTRTVSHNWINWDEVLPAGTYTWTVQASNSQGTQASRARKFIVGPGATPFLVPDGPTMLAAVSAKAHPRALPDAAALATMKSQRQAAVTSLLVDVSGRFANPLPADPATSAFDAAFDASKYTLNSLVAYVYSGNLDTHYNDAKRRVLNLAGWSPAGATAYTRPGMDMASRQIAWVLAYGYDILAPRLSSAEKAQILNSLKARTADMYNDLIGTRSRIAKYPRDSHANQTLTLLAAVSALVAGDLPEAAAWAQKALPQALNAVSPWGGDDGGFANGSAQGVWDMGDTLPAWYALRHATGIDLGSKAWVRNWARYVAYFNPPGAGGKGVFGDGLEMNETEHQARYAKGYSAFAPTPLGRWYAGRLSGEDATRIEVLMAPPADLSTAALPAGTPNSTTFAAIGQVAMHSDLASDTRTSVYFKSSPPPFGAFNHSHADQNSFVVDAGGRRLAIESGYYDAYKSAHWMQWYHQTRAKNAITYDNGKGQVFFEQDGVMGTGGLTQRSSAADHEIVSGDATAAYGGALSKAKRSMVYLRPGLILVYDNLASATPRQWEWNIHALNMMTQASDTKISIASGGQTLCVDMLAGPAMRFTQTSSFTAAPSSGAPQWHGRFHSTQMLGATEFVALLRVGCGNVPATASKANGVWTVNVAGKTVSLGESGASVTAQPSAAATSSTPYTGTPFAVPGTFEAENFDRGGEGVAYHDNVRGNAGGQYRTGEDVDLIVSADSAGGGFVVNNFETGEWLQYTINVPSAGNYNIDLRVASSFTTSAFHLEVDGQDVSGRIAVPATGGWSAFQWLGKQGVPLSAGQHKLRVVADQQYFNLNQVRVTAAAGGGTPPPPAGGGTLPSTGTRAVPTYEAVGLYWTSPGSGATGGCEVKFRRQGTTAWASGLPMWYDSRNGECRGSLVHLAPGAAYEVQFNLPGQAASRALAFSTWSDARPIARTVTVPGGSQTLNITQGGTASGYVLYQAAPGAVLDAANGRTYNVTVDASYVIVKGLTLKGAQQDAIRIAPNVTDVVIEDNDISGWGRQRSGNLGMDRDAGVKAICTTPTLQRVTIQRNRFHSPRYTSNDWSSGHPQGPQAIDFTECGGNHVFRHNDIVSGNGNWFNDGIGGGENFSAAGFPNSDTDIYGNRIENVRDDGIEAEGANRNVRIWGNYIDNSFTAIATTATVTGPVYVFRNVYDRNVAGNIGNVFSKSGSQSGLGDGRRYLLHNTLLQTGGPNGAAYAIGGTGATQPVKNTVSRNNVYHLRSSSATATYQTGTGNTFDNDLVPSGSEGGGATNTIAGVPLYVSGGGQGASGNYQLAANSPGFDRATRIANFNDSFAGAAPDVGAHEAGTALMKFGVAAGNGGSTLPAPTPPPPAPAPSSTPYSGTPVAVPATLEAENFDRGGQNVAYKDNVAGNAGGQYRASEDVDIIASSDSAGGGYVVNNFETGEWLQYTVSVPAAGSYDIDLRVASSFTTSAFHVEVDGVDVTGRIGVPATGGWSAFQWVGRQGIALTAGTHKLRVVADQQYFNLNQIRVASTASGGGTPPPPPPPGGGNGGTPPASLIFRSGYEGSTALAPIQAADCWSNGCWQDVVGTDSSTGFTWPPRINGGNARFQVMSNAGNGSPSTVGNYITNQIQSVIGPRGTQTRAMYSGYVQRGGDATQDPYMILPGSDVREMYISQWIKYPADMLSKLNAGDQWRVVFEWKTYAPGADTDYRVALNIVNYGGGNSPRWRMAGDGWVPSYQLFWQIDNTSIPVPLDRWFKVEIYWKRSSGSDGRVWFAVDGQVVGDRRGPNMGPANAPINRIMMNTVYTGAALPAYQWVDDVQIWSTFPTAAPGDAWYDPPYASH